MPWGAAAGARPKPGPRRARPRPGWTPLLAGVDSCKVENQFDSATVGYTILNPTSTSSLYLLDIKIIDSTGAAVGTANGIEDNVLPDRPSKGEAVGSVSDSAVGPFKCEIGEVTRTSSSG